MNRVPREIYGFGPRLPTRSDRIPHFARIVLLALILGVFAALGVSW